ncbi:hypothetical protein GCM10009789_14510 [Kribbella sancticallisti]|uniref:Sucrase ferredoxin n=1 Tax=Kribbella sancticallisti TaxID=460087 RepID=A0ABN2CTC9_9ACTN
MTHPPPPPDASTEAPPAGPSSTVTPAPGGSAAGSAESVFRCAAAAELRGDSLIATAPPAARWLLIECRVPWPRIALNALAPSPGSGVQHLREEVTRLCSSAGIRPVLIRRHGRIDHTTPRRWALIDSRPGQESIQWGDLPTDEHLLDVLAGTAPGTPSTEPIYLICTHGRHDTCCAIRGRPAAAALTAAHPDRTWECSHIGGDRFAANLVFLPHSLFYGHVPESRAVELATQYDKGLVVPELLRGSGALPQPAQAAQHFARQSGLSLAVDALTPLKIQELSPNHWQVHLDNNGHPHELEVAVTHVTINTPMTCSAQPPGQLHQYTLVPR